MQITPVCAFQNTLLNRQTKKAPVFTQLLKHYTYKSPYLEQLKNSIPLSTTNSDIISVSKEADEFSYKIAQYAERVEENGSRNKDEVMEVFNASGQTYTNSKGQTVKKILKQDNSNMLTMEEMQDGILIRRTSFIDDNPVKIQIFPYGDLSLSHNYSYKENGHLYDYTLRSDGAKDKTSIKQKYSFGEKQTRYLEIHRLNDVWIEKEVILEDGKPLNYRQNVHKNY